MQRLTDNAILGEEDLNDGFMRFTPWVSSSVYVTITLKDEGDACMCPFDSTETNAVLQARPF